MGIKAWENMIRLNIAISPAEVWKLCYLHVYANVTVKIQHPHMKYARNYAKNISSDIFRT